MPIRSRWWLPSSRSLPAYTGREPIHRAPCSPLPPVWSHGSLLNCLFLNTRYGRHNWSGSSWRRWAWSLARCFLGGYDPARRVTVSPSRRVIPRSLHTTIVQATALATDADRCVGESLRIGGQFATALNGAYGREGTDGVQAVRLTRL